MFILNLFLCVFPPSMSDGLVPPSIDSVLSLTDPTMPCNYYRSDRYGRRYVVSSLITAYRTATRWFGEDSGTRPSVRAYASTRSEYRCTFRNDFPDKFWSFFLFYIFLFSKGFEAIKNTTYRSNPRHFFTFLIDFIFQTI